MEMLRDTRTNAYQLQAFRFKGFNEGHHSAVDSQRVKLCSQSRISKLGVEAAF